MSIEKSAKARTDLFARIRRNQSRGTGTADAFGASPAEREAVESYLKSHPRGPLPPMTGDRVAHFIERAQAMQSTAERVANLADAPRAVARYLAANDLPVSGCLWPELAALDWHGAGLRLEARAAIDADTVGVTGAFAGIAETGTLMLLSGPETPGSVSLLPETHVAIIQARRIVAYMEDAWDLLRHEIGLPPRAVSFVSGPSRTGDIEQTIVIGAHGPSRVFVVVVG